MSGSYAEDFAWQQTFAPQILSIIGSRLVKPAPWRLDATRATDFMVIRTPDVAIAARLRRPGGFYFDSFWDEFTLRSWRASGAETELSKILKGCGDWFFYGHVARRRSDDPQDH